jgi:hypothetical protein
MEPGLNFALRPQLNNLVNTGNTRFSGGESHFAHTLNVAHRAVCDKARTAGVAVQFGVEAVEFIPVLSGLPPFFPAGERPEQPFSPV